MSDNNLVDRVVEMEMIYDRVKELISCPKRRTELLDYHHEIEMLRAYYENGQWLEDYEADERGLIPCDLKRAVLSQDVLYDFFLDYDDIIAD